MTTRITSKGKSKKPILHKRENQGNRMIEARLREGAEREASISQTENHTNYRSRLWTSAMVRATGGLAPTRYKEQRDSGTRKENAKTREPKEIASKVIGSNKGQFNGLEPRQPKETSKENELRKLKTKPRARVKGDPGQKAETGIDQTIDRALTCIKSGI